MARRHFCRECGSKDVESVWVTEIPPFGESLPDPYHGLPMPHGHRRMSESKLLDALDHLPLKAKVYGLVIEVYARNYPEPITDWEVLYTLEDWLEPDEDLQRTDVAPRSTHLRDTGWIRWVGQTMGVKGKMNKTALLTRRGAAQLGLDPEFGAEDPRPEDLDEVVARHMRNRRRRVVRRPNNWS